MYKPGYSSRKTVQFVDLPIEEVEEVEAEEVEEAEEEM